MHTGQRIPSNAQNKRSWLLFLLAIGLCTCSGPLGVLVDIGSWPEQAQSLRVTGVLNGAPYPQPLSFPPETTRFVVLVPDGDSGQLSLTLAALDGNGCLVASARTQVDVEGGLQRVAEADVALATLTPPSCPPPQVTGISPVSGDNTTTTKITISGSGFLPGAMVTVGGSPCSNANVVSATQITCTAPVKLATCGPQAVVVTNPDNQKVTGGPFYYRPTGVAFGAPMILSGPGLQQAQVAVADFNADGNPDLAAADFKSADVSVYLNDRAGGFHTATSAPSGMGPIGVAVGDINKDGKPDLLVANDSDNTVSFLAGTGNGSFAGAVTIASGDFSSPTGVVLGDFNNDGNLDAAVTNVFSTKVVILIGDGTGKLAVGVPVTVGYSARSLAVADLDKDGNLDLVTPNLSDSTVSYRPGHGDGTFGTGSDMPVGKSPTAAAVADMNGDKNPDILVSNQDDATMTVLLGDGAGGFTAAKGSPILVGGAPDAISIADFNGDGIPDLAIANFGTSNVSVLLGDGMGGFNQVQGSPFATPAGPFGMAAADFNGDGLLDLATGNKFANNTSVLFATCF
jgi:hypothetical protein